MQKEEAACPLGTPTAILAQQSNAARAIQHAWKRYTSLDYLDLLLNEMALSRIQSLETIPDARWPFNMLPSVGTGLAVPPQGAGWRVVRAECSSSSTSSCLQPSEKPTQITVGIAGHTGMESVAGGDDARGDQTLADSPLLGLSYLSVRDGLCMRRVSTCHGGCFTYLLDATATAEHDPHTD